MKQISRRRALQLFTSAPVVAAMSWTVEEAHAAQAQVQSTPRQTPFQPKFFTRHEYATVTLLVDLIIPRDERSGSATEAGVPEFMDFMVIDQPARQTAMRGGLAFIDHLCDTRFDKLFTECSAAERRGVLDDLAYPARVRPELAQGAAFFTSFRDLTSSGFWSSKMGVEDLHYMGNKALAEWNGCSTEALEHLGVKYQEVAWKTLFDGKSLDAWRGYKNAPIPAGWRIVDGTLTKETPVADIVSKDEFADFELEIEWKIGEAGNSGIFYRGTEEYDHIYWSAPEYQLLDDIKGADNKTRLTCAGAAYAVYPSPPGHLKAVGDWNKTRIVVRGAHVEHWLNDFKLLEYELWSPDWNAKVKASKFDAYPNYGRARTGHIAMQGDHAGVLAFRNIRIRELR